MYAIVKSTRPWLLGVTLLLAGCRLSGTSGTAQDDAAVASAPATTDAAAPPPSAAASAGMTVEATPATAASPPATPAAGATPSESAPTEAITPDGTKPFAFDEPAAGQTVAAGSCGFPALDGTTYRLFAAGGYGGKRLDFAIDDSGNQAGRFDVAVNHTAEPVVLMLGGYDPAVWHVGWTRGTRIAAVLLSGYHQQFITGLPKDVPVLISTYDNRGPCGYFYVSADQARTLNPIARKVFGRNVDMVYPADRGQVVVGAPLQGAPLVTDASARDDSAFRIADRLAGGEQGLAYAVSQGWLREARQGDADAWASAYARLESSDMPPIAGGQTAGRIRMHNAYVVLKPFKLPPGLYGAHSATFFVPKGVARPTGEPGHSTLYDFNTMTCRGTMCDHE